MEKVAPESFRQTKVGTEWCPGASPGGKERRDVTFTWCDQERLLKRSNIKAEAQKR